MLFHLFLVVQVVSGIVCVSSTCSDTDTPECVQYKATVRDIPCGSVDFESAFNPGGVATGILARNLDGNRPRFPPFRLRSGNSIRFNGVLTSQGAEPANSGQFYFDEWFMDIPRYSIAVEYTMNLTRRGSGLYVYDSNENVPVGFFPIDTAGFIEEYRGRYVHNYSFTTYVSYPFYYRGGESFAFSGDDDLWVFLDKVLVTVCDLGNPHGPAGCTFNADSFNLAKNTSHTLDVYNAERHTTGSNFKVTTSILPKNIPPTSSNTTQTVNGPSDTTFILPAFDENSDPLIVTIYPPYPKYGSIITEKDTITANSTESSYTTSKYSLQYVANNLYIGYTNYDTIYYSVTDHCATVGTYSVAITVVGNLVQTVFLPPILQPTIYVNLTRGEIKSLNLTAVDPQNKPLFYLDDTQRSGVWSSCINVLGLDLDSGLFSFQGIQGNCLFSYLVSNKFIDPPTQGFVQINVIQPYVPPAREETIYQQPYQPQPTDEVVINIVPNNNGITQEIVNISLAVGISVVMMIAAAIIAWILYTKVLWKRFEAQWKNEFLSAEIKDNPLYLSSAKETFNPLYQGEDTTGTSVPQNSTVNRETYIAAETRKAGNRQTQLGGSRASNMGGGQGSRQSKIGGSRASEMSTNGTSVKGTAYLDAPREED